jgi:hypothetical protein
MYRQQIDTATVLEADFLYANARKLLYLFFITPRTHGQVITYLGNASCIPEMRPWPMVAFGIEHEQHAASASVVSAGVDIMYLSKEWVTGNFQACKLDLP